MIIKIVSSLKYIAVFTLVLFSSIACERDFEDVGVGLVDNNLFKTKDTTFEITAYHQNITASRVDYSTTQYLIGKYMDANFGEIKGSFVSQLGLPGSTDAALKFGDNISIDTIILEIPYYSTKKEKNSDGTPNFKLDSIQGDQDVSFILSVHELGTFLNTLNPEDPTKKKIYYSNETYTKKALLYSGLFKPNPNDTVLYVKRSFFKDDESIDTIKQENLSPSIKIPLDTTFFRNQFIDNQDADAFTSSSKFIDYFRGIYIDANGNNGSLMTLAMSNAKVFIYYTNTELKDEKDADKDLNGDGDKDDTNVVVRTKETKEYPLSGIKASKYERDYANTPIQNYISNDNTLTLGDEKKVYIQGAAGSIAILELFNDANFEAIKQENWLINEANITLYVDETSGTNVPEKLLLYNYDNNSQLLDVYAEAQINGIGGAIERNDDNAPIEYKFRITNYINKVLKSDDPEKELSRIGLKVLNASDIPDFNTLIDTLITDFSWKAKGVVLKGNNLPKIENDEDPTRLKLEIFYTINN